MTLDWRRPGPETARAAAAAVATALGSAICGACSTQLLPADFSAQSALSGLAAVRRILSRSWPTPPIAGEPVRGSPIVGVWPAATPPSFSQQWSRSMSASVMAVFSEGLPGRPLAIRAARPTLSYPCQAPPRLFRFLNNPWTPYLHLSAPGPGPSAASRPAQRQNRSVHCLRTERFLLSAFFPPTLNGFPVSPLDQPGSTGFSPHHRPAGRIQHCFSRQAWPSWQGPPGNTGRVFAEVRAPSGPGPRGCQRPKDSGWLPTISRVRTEPTG